MICGMNANNIESHIVMHTGRQKKTKFRISKLMIVIGGGGFGRFCVPGDFILRSQSRQQFVGQSQFLVWTAVLNLWQGASGSPPLTSFHFPSSPTPQKQDPYIPAKESVKGL